MDKFKQEVAIKEQIIDRGISTPKLIKALTEIPREDFVPENKKEQTWFDGPLDIGYNSSISAPYLVAKTTDLLGLHGQEKVLEVGTGSGYQAVLLSKLTKMVYSIDIIPELTALAKDRAKKLGIKNVLFLTGDGSMGYPQEAPFDAIVVTAGSPKIPQPLIAQLKVGGKLIIPVGDEFSQSLLLVKRRVTDIETYPIEAVRFVPLIGRYAWRI